LRHTKLTEALFRVLDIKKSGRLDRRQFQEFQGVLAEFSENSDRMGSSSPSKDVDAGLKSYVREREFLVRVGSLIDVLMSEVRGIRSERILALARKMADEWKRRFPEPACSATSTSRGVQAPFVETAKQARKGRPRYEVLAEHRRVPRWKDWCTAELAAWHDAFLSALAASTRALDAAVASPKLPPLRHAVARVGAAPAASGGEPSRKEALAERMAGSDACVFRDARSQAIDASVLPRWSFKVLGRSISRPPCMGYQPAPVVEPTDAGSIFAPSGGGWLWEASDRCPGRDRSVAADALAAAMQRCTAVAFRPANSSATDLSLAGSFAQVAAAMGVVFSVDKARRSHYAEIMAAFSGSEKHKFQGQTQESYEGDWDENFDDT